ncbi:RE1-silencing transcription factor B [Penaeus vannamei]|uniref:RE1-silencing transcription factor B n=1 Tax=Penaeus vannamei TaxID=6689 RepID=UPI000F67AF3A|nr:RE1-silencing transcription factor B-like [Penaeus vannamei]
MERVDLDSDAPRTSKNGTPAGGRGLGATNRMHQCPYCEYTTYFTTNLRNHMRRHTGEKPYSCQYCAYSAITKQSLERHLRTHNKGQTFACRFCPYTTDQDVLLKRHVSCVHSGDKSSTCPHCSYQAVDSDDLRNHIMIHHNIQS